MTIDESKTIIERDLNCLKQNKALPDSVKAMEIATNALEEIQKYRAIGTPDECRAAKEVKKEITEIVNRQLIAGKDNYKETYNCFYEIVKIIQDNY